MLARQVKTGAARTEQLLRHALLSRLPQSSRFATEASTSLPPQASSPPLPVQERRSAVRMISPTMSEPEFSAQVVHGRSVLTPIRHPKTHGIPVAMLHVRGHDHRALDLFLHFASHAAGALGVPVSAPVRLPTQRSLWTVPKGPFVHKKNQENFDRKVHKRALKAWDATDSVVDRWIRYIQTYPQPSLGLRIVRWHRAPVGIGREHAKSTSEAHKETLRLQNVTDRQRVEEVARQIVQQEMKAANLTPEKPKVITQKKSAGGPKGAKS
ncbi:hypothetical protein M0805_002945 [Coniferiporia weirii]|nr:hypothetical protein M0805_002945 [Coniferiporia weirii]